jgi:hypothetical protein
VRRARSLVVIAAAAVCAAAPLASCLDATEIVLQLSTDVSCTIVSGTDTVAGTQVVIRVGSPANIASNPPTHIESTSCTPGDATASPTNDLGSVVVVPSGGFDESVSITVALSDAAGTLTSTCFPEASNPSCIYAHRQISFLPHTRVTLPIVLSSACAGVNCIAPQTCDPDTRQCTSGNIDPHDCGTNCSTGEDSGGVPDVTIDVPVGVDVPVFDSPVVDSPVLDAPVLDAPKDVSTCQNPFTLCGNKCVNVLSDPGNCGACFVDCNGGACAAGLCTLSTQATGSCLAVYNGNVYVATSAGVYVYPSNGGSGSLYNNVADPIIAMASMPGHVAWFANNTLQAYVYEYPSKKPYTESNTTATALMALNGGAFAWYDAKQTRIIYQSTQQSTWTPYDPLITSASSVIPVAMGTKYVYASLPADGELLYTDGTTYAYIPNVPSPGAIIVDDPSKLSPNVFDVEKSTVVQRDSQLGNAKTYASSSTAITSIVWDGAKVIANATSEISYAQGTTFTQITKATPAPKCIAVDSNAVYWLDATAGLYKHAKP